jgi:hypothetical protein
MNELFIPYELALRLKEKGFDLEYCFGYWTPYSSDHPYLDISQHYYRQDTGGDVPGKCLAPLWQQVIDWFISKQIYLDINITPIVFENGQKYRYQFLIDSVTTGEYLFHSADQQLFYLTYKEALTQAIIKALTLI